MHDMRRGRYSPREPFRAKADQKWEANKNKTEPGAKLSTGTDYAKEIVFIQARPESLK